MNNGFFNFFDDYFIKVFVGSSVYEILHTDATLYYIMVVLYLVYLLRKYLKWRHKQRVKAQPKPTSTLVVHNLE